MLAWMPGTPESSSSAQFPDADWLTLDVIQSGHHDTEKPVFLDAAESSGGGDAQSGAGGIPVWMARSSYDPIRKMYATPKKGGGIRPVMDLEAHYENTHYCFRVSECIFSPPRRKREFKSRS